MTVRGAAARAFEERLAAQASPPVTAARLESEMRRGHSLRIRISVTVDAPDLGQAAVAAWGVFQAADEDAAAWGLAQASAEIQPSG